MTYQFANWKYATADNSVIDLTVTDGETSFPFTYGGPGDGAVSDAVYSYIQANSPTITAYVAPPIAAEQVQLERVRRLGLGFDYDFADARGVHRIGTTPADMEGWREVIDYANALIDTGDTDTQIAIITDTGPTLVTAPEWQAVMLQAAHVRQVLWASSFALQAMSPIPENYTDDSFWTP